MALLPNKLLESAKNVSRKPDTKSRKQKNIARYVTGQDPTKCASLNVAKPEK